MSDPRYHLLEKLESGGMAEVFLGEATSVQGFKKRVAIKRVLPHLASHTNFIGMFLDEARLGARLTHANIVSVFDIGKSDNSFFIVMEFVDGTNLKKIMETLRVKGAALPAQGRDLHRDGSLPRAELRARARRRRWAPGRSGAPRRVASEHPDQQAGGGEGHRLRSWPRRGLSSSARTPAW